MHMATYFPGNTYITFALHGKVFGLNISPARETLVLTNTLITKTPMTEDGMLGFVDVRGQGIPVFDLRRKLGLPPADPTDNATIIVVELDVDGISSTIGVVVDRVQDVLNISSEQIDHLPRLVGNIDTGFIQGLARETGGRKARPVILLSVPGLSSLAVCPINLLSTIADISQAMPGIKPSAYRRKTSPSLALTGA